jgi:dephospho-CoA kinase
MLKIGITGGIGSGKTTISKIFEVLGIPVFYADDHAKRVMTEDNILINAIRGAFGDEAYFNDGTLNRKYIAGIVFNDADRLATLNHIVHPATFRAFNAWVELIRGVPYVLKEAALLFESDAYKLCDKTVMVYAPLNTRVQRVVNRDHLSEAEVNSRNARQMPDEQKMQLADFTLNNNDSQLVIPQVLKLHQQFLDMAKAQ